MTLTFGEAMAIARRRADVTQNTLAQELGIAPRIICWIERDCYPYRADHHRSRIMEVLNMPDVFAMCELEQVAA